MSTNLFNPPPTFTLPLSLGQDLFCNFVYKPLVVDGSNNPVLDANGNLQYAVANYPAGAVVTLTIATSTPVTATATISGSVATVTVPYSTVDGIAKGVLWSLAITYSSGVHQVMCNGTTVRSDGK